MPSRSSKLRRSGSSPVRVLVLDELAQRHFASGGEAGKDVALIVDAKLLGGADRRIGQRNERGDLAVLDAADADALLEARIGLGIGLRVGNVEDVVLVDEDAARPAELAPLRGEVAVGIENLDAAVRAVGHVEAAGGIERQAVRHVELAGFGAVLAPRLDEFAVLAELDDAVVGGV